MDSSLEAVYARLKNIRERDDLSIRPCRFIKPKYVSYDNVERDFRLRYYQIQGVLHLLLMKRFVLGDDCGLGKTPTVISSCAYLADHNPELDVVVLTNKSAVDQWGQEFERFTSGFHVFVCKGTPAKRAVVRENYVNSPGPKVLIMGYRTMVQDFTAMQDWGIGVFVCDEATAFKNHKTQVHQRCTHLANNAERSWGLSATIIKNNLLEGWGIYKVICPGLFGTYNHFVNEFCITRMQRIKGNRQIPIIVGYRRKAIKEFKDTIDPFFLGRSKLEVASDLPTLTTQEICVPMNAKQHAKYAEALNGLLVVGGGEEKEVSKLTSIIYCQQISNHLELLELEGGSGKMEQLLELMLESDFATEKVIIYSRFRRMVDIAQRIFEEKGIKTTRITGSENEDQRKEAQRLFQDPESGVNKIFITNAAAEAVNLQAASAIIFYDSPWSAGDYIQILGRMIRIGSIHDRVYAIHLLTQDSVDYRVMGVLRLKMQLINDVIGKRIKGDEDDEFVVEDRNDISDIFHLLQEDARKFKK